MSVTLKVAKTSPKFVGRGIALVDPIVMEAGIATGDVIEIAGKKKSYVLLWSSQQEDYGKGLIRITKSHFEKALQKVKRKGRMRDALA